MSGALSERKESGRNHFGLRALVRGESGQVVPMVAVFIVALIGITGLVLDVGRAMVSSRELQVATDAAALAGAQALPSASAALVADQYSAISGGKNAFPNLPNVTMSPGYPMVKCLTTLQNEGLPCSAPASGNALEVREQVTVPLYFARLFGQKTWTLSSTATAATRGASPSPYNVALIVDTTLSMAYMDSNCGSTQITCALGGVRVLLQSLDPCASSMVTCSISNGNSTNSVDRVSLFTFPQISTSSAGNDYDCGSSVPTAAQYTFPNAGATTYSSGSTTYQIASFHSDYRTSDTSTTLNKNSNLTGAAGGVSGCSGMAPPTNAGYYGTYYASTIYAAQAALTAEQTANPGSQNVMIILGDGDSNAPAYNGSVQVMAQSSFFNRISNPATGNGLYPSWVGECGQAVVAAQAATAAGTRVYTVAYGAKSSGCTSDDRAGSYPNITPCQTMQKMASATQYFYSDYLQSGSNSNCYASQSVTALSDIFTQIAGDLTVARLIPDNTP